MQWNNSVVVNYMILAVKFDPQCKKNVYLNITTKQQ